MLVTVGNVRAHRRFVRLVIWIGASDYRWRGDVVVDCDGRIEQVNVNTQIARPGWALLAVGALFYIRCHFVKHAEHRPVFAHQVTCQTFRIGAVSASAIFGHAPLFCGVGNEASDRTFAFNVSFPTFEARNEFVPRVWAVRKVGGLLDEIRLHGERAELRQEVITIARRFGLVTPYTSYLVAPDVQMPTPIQPNSDLHISLDADLRMRAPAQASTEHEESRFDGFETTVTQSAPSHSGGSAPAAQSAPSGATGERGRRISEQVHEMAGAERAEDATSQGVRFALGRAFAWQSGAYVDANHHAGMRELRVRPMSRAYFTLLTLRPELRAAFALGEHVIVTLDGDRAIVIDPASPDTDEETARAFVR